MMILTARNNEKEMRFYLRNEHDISALFCILRDLPEEHLERFDSVYAKEAIVQITKMAHTESDRMEGMPNGISEIHEGFHSENMRVLRPIA